MKKRIVTIALVVALVATCFAGTYAYLKDDDAAHNVMTVGNVYIEQLELQRKDGIDYKNGGARADGDELEAFAEANGISEGKAWLIRNLLASGSTNLTEENLLKLSTQELILLGQERNVQAESTYGSADTSKYIGKDKAVDAALSSAGISRSQASGVRAEYDSENGFIIYEVEFTSGGIEYEYKIDASTGNVISYEKEKADNGHDDDRDDGHDDDRDDGHDDDHDSDDDHDHDDDHDDHDDHDHDHDDHDD
jgi:uncharacterized membrane protein YkoI